MQLTAILRPGSCLGRPKQFIRAMKLSALFLIVFCLHLSARTSGQTVTLDFKNVPVQQVFKEASRQTGISIIYNEKLFNGFAPVTISMKDAAIQDVLRACLKNQPFEYSFEGNLIVIKKKNTEPLTSAGGSSFIDFPPPIDIHGRVTDSLGNPLAGASVTVKGSKSGTETDAQGNFTLHGVKENSTLLISYTGYGTKFYRIKGGEVIAISLSKSVSPLDEIQVIAYGYTTQRLSTGDISTVKGEDIEKQPVSNAMLALEGRVPGMQITQPTGNLGGAVTVQIRGKNSILNGTEPFYVIDGVPYTSQLLPNLNGSWGISGTAGYFTTQGNGSPLNYINPSDIERIDILKDADATAIYGSRAANGAVLITTKKGQAGKTRVGFNIQSGQGHITRMLDLLNTRQYLDMRYEAQKNDNVTPNPSADYDLTLWDTTRQTNWQKYLIGGNSHYTDAEVSVSGGNSNTQFLVGAGYHRETSVFPQSFPDARASVHLSLLNTSNDKKFHFQLTASYSADENKTPPVDLTGAATYLPPDAPPVYKPDGTLNWAPDPSTGFGSWQNPLAVLQSTFNGKTNNLIGQAILSYQIVHGLEIKSSFGYTNMQVNETSTIPATASDPAYLPLYGNSLRSARYVDNSSNSWIIEPQVNYSAQFSRLQFTALVGTTFEQNTSNGIILNGSGYATDLLLSDPLSASSLIAGQTTNSVYKYNALFSRLNFNWDDKYILTLSGRRDGSSRFGEANQFHNFWSAGGAWIFSNSDFFRDQLSFFSLGKLRGSYGTTGNDQIGDYQFMDLYYSTSYGNPYQGANGISSAGLSNPYLQWEETRKAEIALELGFLKDRILLNTNYYRNQSSNELLFYSLSSVTGFTSITKNFPATIRNSGLELVLNTVNIKTKNFKWSTSINLTVPKNKLVSFPDLESSPYSYSFIIGQPISIQRVYHAQVDPATGIYKFEDIHGAYNFQPTFGQDNFVNINIDPKYYGGLLNTVSYKEFQIDFLFQFTKQMGRNYLFYSLPGAFLANQPVDVLNRWQKPGDNAQIQRFVGASGANIDGNSFSIAQSTAAQSSDLVYSDASFIRLKNVSISWTAPKGVSKSLLMSNLRIYVQGQNLLTITHYKGFDPESQSSSALPPLRMLTAGIQASF